MNIYIINNEGLKLVYAACRSWAPHPQVKLGVRDLLVISVRHNPFSNGSGDCNGTYSLLQRSFVIFTGTRHRVWSGVTQPGQFWDYPRVEDLFVDDKACDIHLHWELMAIPCNTMDLEWREGRKEEGVGLRECFWNLKLYASSTVAVNMTELQQLTAYRRACFCSSGAYECFLWRKKCNTL